MVLIELIKVLKKRGVECYVMLPWWGPLIKTLKSLEVSFGVGPYTWWMWKKSPGWERIFRTILNFVMPIFIAIRIKQWKCDVVCTNAISICVGALTAKLINKPHVLYVHEFGEVDQGLTFDLGENFSLRLMNQYSSKVIYNSHAVAKRYQEHFEKGKTKVIYYPVTIAPCVPIGESHVPIERSAEIQCAIIGNVQKGKRQEDTIRAIAKLVHEGMNIELLVVGRPNDSDYYESIRDLIKREHLETRVRFTGFVENPFPLIQATDIVLMCSTCEAFGRVTVEAMRAGRPVVGAKSGGTVELIRDGWNGLLFAPGDYKEIAEKIRYLHQHPNIARQMGANGQRWAEEQFTEDRFANEILEVLQQAIAQS